MSSIWPLEFEGNYYISENLKTPVLWLGKMKRKHPTLSGLHINKTNARQKILTHSVSTQELYDI
jgi:hypothetical protein